MSPVCTPEKTDYVYDSSAEINSDSPSDLYFIPPKLEEDLHETVNDHESEKARKNLLGKIPKVAELFDVHKQIGEGTFSTVFLGTLRGQARGRKYALKHIVPTSHPNRIFFELKCLKLIGGVHNVAGVELCLRNLDNTVFVMEYLKHQHFSFYVSKIGPDELKLYMKNLLIALAHVHSFDIIHRDVKPSNFLYDRDNGKFLLVDFGLAQDVPKRSRPTTVKDRSEDDSVKRKRDALSPIHNIMQPSKRIGLNVTVEPGKENYKNIDSRPGIKFLASKPPGMLRSPPEVVQKAAIECTCYGKPRMCNKCLVLPKLNAARAGTPGYRPPEVLFKYQYQTNALDMWAAGIIMISIMSGCTNFFESPDDFAAIGELITIFGYDAIERIGLTFGRLLVSNKQTPKLDLSKICCILRHRVRESCSNSSTPSRNACASCMQSANLCVCIGTPLDPAIPDIYPHEAYQVALRLLDLNPNSRITAAECLQLQYFS